jgi:succinyl-diaminopimelate desuccinylase
MTVNMGIMNVENNDVSVVLDLRIPVTVDYEMVIEKIKSTFVGFEVEILAHQPAHHVSADSKEVQTLLAVYSEVTGLPAGTRAIGGGTYARAFDNAVAFGPQLPGREDLAHQKDEYIIIEDILINARIYAHSIARLMA